MQERGDEVLIQKVHHKFHLKEKVFANSSPSYDLSHSPIYQTINMKVKPKANDQEDG